MKVIYPNNISGTPTANESDPNYDVANVLTDYRTQVWKSTTAINRADAWDSATEWDGDTHWAPASGSTLPYIQATVTGPSSGIAIINTNADEVHIKVTDINSVVILDEKYSPGAYSSDIWVEYPLQQLQHTVKMTFLPPHGSVAEVGAIRIGTVMEFPNPAYGFTESLVDTSIVRELSCGAMYYRLRNILREFSGLLLLARNHSFYRFMTSLCKTIGATPIPWLLADGMAEDNLWVVFGRLSMPTGSHDYLKHSAISFKITEGV